MNTLYGSMLGCMANDYFRVRKGGQLPYEKNRSDVLKDNERRTKQGRNELCNCGSGKKFKKCHGKVINVVEEEINKMNKFLNWLFTSKSSLIRREVYLSGLIEHYEAIDKNNSSMIKSQDSMIENLKVQIEMHVKMNDSNVKIKDYNNKIINSNDKTIIKLERMVEELNIINWDNLREIDNLKLGLNVKVNKYLTLCNI